MNRTLAFAGRNAREIVRDRINLLFGMGFPVILLLLLTAIQKHVPTELFPVARLAPGIAVFGLSFISLFSGMLIACDRAGAFVQRLFTSPMRAGDFLLGYILPLFPMALAQGAVCYLTALCLGLPATANLLPAMAVLLPTALLFIAIGLLCGSLFTDRQVGGLCGALLTNLSAWLSDTWFEVSLVGGAFERVANALPFIHAVKAGRAALAGDWGGLFPHLWWVVGYAAAVLAVAVWVFRRRMRG